jgi:uncharacterized membrane protein (DUF2068 family)
MIRQRDYSKFDLRGCARHGHVTYRPTGPDAERLVRNLCTESHLGEAWRCLRCGTYVLGAPKQSGPADQAPIVLRGKALRSATILRLLAAERIVRALLLFAAGYAIYRFHADQSTLQAIFNRDLPALRTAGAQFHYNVDSSTLVALAHHTLWLKGKTLTIALIFVLIYASLQIIEGIGLWLLKRWGEYFAAVATSLFIPFEIFELSKHLSITKTGAFVINVAAVIYLVYSKHLFGLRGGRAAYEHELQSESLLEVEAAADTTPAEVVHT